MTLVLAHTRAGSFALVATTVTFAALLAARGARRNRGRVVGILAGALALVVATSPVVEAAGESSFAAHMAQHLLLVAVAAPVLGAVAAHRALIAGAAGLAPDDWSGHQARSPSAAKVAGATVLSVAALLLWHLPFAWESALGADWVHGIEHAALLGSGYWFWCLVLDPRTPSAFALPAILFSAVPQGLLGGLLTFGAVPLYATQSVGTDPLADQQLAGLLMWIPGGLVHLLAAAVVTVRGLERSRRRVERRELVRASRVAGRVTT